ncbi:DUF5333 domain-containing protein [Aliiroseovarius crassostreae]|uniref:DUF5333 domain-containing protein n=1 Tax=Aliiroseovarius crassostreae TaxID=154981 RepID=UPI00220E4FED|nr:DUF5333 domain-containing protein [Aliiroseovarius crassostreae]UWP87959.1 DUF5333 domain-containing protein [Aliiroseovarius crassostreae]
MTKFKTVLASVLAATIATSAFAVDYAVMRKDTRVHNELLWAALAHLIDENCDTLSLRKFRLFNKAMALQAYAHSLGYSIRETVAYVDSKEEQERFRAIAEPMLADMGARKGDEESYCAVGRAEMDKGTFTGKLLSE